MSWTRRSLGREAVSAIHYPFTMFEGRGKKGLSQFRIVLFSLSVTYIRHWPETWGPWEFAALAVLALALPVADLFAAAPVAEGLAALVAVFAGVIQRRIGFGRGGEHNPGEDEEVTL